MSQNNFCFFESTNQLQVSVLRCRNVLELVHKYHEEEVPVAMVIEPQASGCWGEEPIISRKRPHSQAFDYYDEERATMAARF